jgi:hypothetical protein
MKLHKYILRSITISALLFATTTTSEANPVNQSKPATTPANASEQADTKMERDDRLFDNTSMFTQLKKAELLCQQSDMVAAKKQWTKVIEFMHKPRWFPTAAMVPVSLEFAKLADICIKHEQIDDAHELMHAAFEFPFHLQKEDIETDKVAVRLVEYDKKTANVEKCKIFLEYAIQKSLEPRRSTYQKLLDSLKSPIAK